MASVAHEVGIPYTLSTMGTTTIEDLAAAAPDARLWFQLYLWRDRAFGKDLVHGPRPPATTRSCSPWTPRSAAHRLRDVRNGLSIPPALTLRTFLDGRAAPELVVRPAHHRAAARSPA